MDISDTKELEIIKKKKGTEYLIGTPKEWPTELTSAICAYAKTNKAIRAIWLNLVMYSANEKGYLLTVDCKGNINNIFQEIGRVGQPFIEKGMFMDIVPLNKLAGKNKKPFYKKSLFF